MNWKPMEFFKRGSNMMVTPNGRIDDTGQGILPFLKAGFEETKEFARMMAELMSSEDRTCRI